MRKLMPIVAIFMVLMVGHSGNAGGVTEIDYGAVLPADMKIAKKAISILMDECPGFKRYWGDIETAAVGVMDGNEWDYRTEQYGWDRWVSLTMVVSSRPRAIPTYARAAGHHLRYFMGAGALSGVAIQKEQGVQVCDVAIADSQPYFLVAPRFAVVSDLPPPKPRNKPPECPDGKWVC